MTVDTSNILAKTIQRLLRRRSYSHLRKIVNRTHPVDLARSFSAFSLNEQLTLYNLIDDPGSRGILLAKLDISDLHPFAAAIPLQDLVAATEHLADDDLVDLVENLPPDIGRQVLKGLQRESSEEVGGSSAIRPQNSRWHHGHGIFGPDGDHHGSRGDRPDPKRAPERRNGLLSLCHRPGPATLRGMLPAVPGHGQAGYGIERIDDP